MSAGNKTRLSMAAPLGVLPFLLLSLFLAGRTAVAQDDSSGQPSSGSPLDAVPAGASSAKEDLRLASEQAKLAAKYKELEQLLLRMAEVTKGTDPRRAAVLRQVFAQSKEKQVGLQFEDLVKLLEKDQLYQAGKGQTAIKQDLSQLLELLLSGDRNEQIPNERAEIKKFIERINKIIRQEQGLQGETEGQGDPLELAERQEGVAKTTQELEQELKKFDDRNNPAGDEGESGDAEAQPGENESDENEPDEEADGESESGDGKPGDESDEKADGKGKGDKADKSADGKSGEKSDQSEKQDDAKSDEKRGEKTDGDKQGNEKPDAKPQDKSSDESDRKPGESSSGQSGEPSESESEGKSPSGKSQPGQQGSQQQPSGESDSESGDADEQNNQQQNDESPARRRIREAQERMKEAKRRLEEAQRRGAADEQQKAIDALQQAKAELEEILRQLREEEIERTLAMLEGRFRKMLQMQIEVYEGTVRLDRVPEDERDRDIEIEAAKLSRREAQITAEADKTLNLLREEGSSAAFPEAVDQMREDMEQVTGRLARAKVGQITQGVEQDIVKALEEMIQALQKAQKEAQQRRAGGGGGGGGQDQALVDQIAELKMIRALQMRVNTRTKRYSRMLEDGVEQAEQPDLIEAVRRLSEREDRIYQTARDIVVGRNQ